MKRASSPTESNVTKERPNKIGRFRNTDVTVAPADGKCSLIQEIVPYEMVKCIFSYCATTCLKNLSVTSKYLLDCLNQHKSDVLTISYNPNDPLDPFKPEVLPDFKTGNLGTSMTLYLYSLTHLENPICVHYRNMFNHFLDIYIRLWLQNEFTFVNFNDHYKLISNNAVVTLNNDQNTHILVLGKLIKRYIENGNLVSDLKLQTKVPHISNVLGSIHLLKSHSIFSSIITNTICTAYQELVLGFNEADNIRLLTVFVDQGSVDPISAQKLKSYAITKLNNPSAGSLHFDLVVLLQKLIAKDILTLSEKDIEFLKNFVITKLNDPIASLLHRVLLVLLVKLMHKPALKVNDNDVEFLKNYAIAKFKDPSASLLYNSLLCLLIQIDKSALTLSDNDVEFLKNFAIAKFKDPSASSLYNNLLALFGLLMNKHAFRLNGNDIESLKNFTIERLNDPTARSLDFNLVILLQRLMQGQILKLSDNDIEFLNNFAVARLKDFSKKSIHRNIIKLLLQLIEKCSLKLNDSDVRFFKNYAITELENSECSSLDQEGLLFFLSFITEAKELFPLVSVKFFEDQHSFFLESTGHVLEIRRQNLAKFYELFLAHPDRKIGYLAANISLMIENIFPDETN